MKARKAPAHLQRFADRLAIDLEPIVEAKLERVYDAALSAASSELAVEKPRAQPLAPNATRAARPKAAPKQKPTPSSGARACGCSPFGRHRKGCREKAAQTEAAPPSGKPSRLTSTAREILARTRAHREGGR